MGTFYGHSRRMQQRNFFDLNSLAQPTFGHPDGLTAFFLNPEANIGGPVVLPKIYNGRNKTFFFFGWNKIIEKISNFQAFGTVPTPAMKNGDFSFGGLAARSTTRRRPAGLRMAPGPAIPFPGNPGPAQQGLIPWPRDPADRSLGAAEPAGTFNSAGPSGKPLV